MNIMMAYAMGAANRGKEEMVFDWDKAAHIIKERKPRIAKAGLRDDWEWTGGTIYNNGEIVTNRYTYLASTWAVPELMVDDEVMDCFKMESYTPGWNYDTKWPESARKILKGEM